jgi:hypothetical protein
MPFSSDVVEAARQLGGAPMFAEAFAAGRVGLGGVLVSDPTGLDH